MHTTQRRGRKKDKKSPPPPYAHDGKEREREGKRKRFIGRKDRNLLLLSLVRACSFIREEGRRGEKFSSTSPLRVHVRVCWREGREGIIFRCKKREFCRGREEGEKRVEERQRRGCRVASLGEGNSFCHDRGDRDKSIGREKMLVSLLFFPFYYYILFSLKNHF